MMFNSFKPFTFIKISFVIIILLFSLESYSQYITLKVDLNRDHKVLEKYKNILLKDSADNIVQVIGNGKVYYTPDNLIRVIQFECWDEESANHFF
jgi:hypothetical protein